MQGATLHGSAQVNVAIMLAPVAFLGHITSQPVEAMARMETDKVSIQTSLLYKLVPTTVLLCPVSHKIAGSVAAAPVLTSYCGSVHSRIPCIGLRLAALPQEYTSFVQRMQPYKLVPAALQFCH